MIFLGREIDGENFKTNCTTKMDFSAFDLSWEDNMHISVSEYEVIRGNFKFIMSRWKKKSLASNLYDVCSSSYLFELVYLDYISLHRTTILSLRFHR